MTDTYKILGQALTGEVAVDNTTVIETIAYEVPAGAKASVSAIAITNSDVADQTYRVAFVPSADVETAVGTVTVQEVVGTEQVGTPTVVGTQQVQIGSTDTQFIVKGTTGTQFAVSSNGGVTWTLKTFPSAGKVVSGNSVTILDSSSPTIIYTSTDLVNWPGANTPYRQTPISYGNQKFVYSFNNNYINYSSNGTTWTSVSTPLNYISSIDFANTYCFVRGSDINGQPVMYVTTNFSSWTQASFSYTKYGYNLTAINSFNSGSSGTFLPVVYNGERYMLAAVTAGLFSNGISLYTSTNGTTWEAGYEPTPLNTLNINAFGQFTFLQAMPMNGLTPGEFIFGVQYSYAPGLDGIWSTNGVNSTSGPSGLTKQDNTFSMMNMYANTLTAVSDYGFSFSADMTARPFPTINGTVVWNLGHLDQGSEYISNLTFIAQDLYDAGNGNGYGPVSATFYLLGGSDSSPQDKAALAAWINAIQTSGFGYGEFYFNFENVSPVSGLHSTRVYDGNIYLFTEYYGGNWYAYTGQNINDLQFMSTPSLAYAEPYWGTAVDSDPIYEQQDVIEIIYTTQDVYGPVDYSVPQSLNKHFAIYNKTIASGETHEIKGGVTLSAGDQIRVYSDSAEIITNIYGVEIA